MSLLSRIGITASASSCRPLLTHHIAVARTCIAFKRWKYRGVIFDMGGVILPSPFPIAKGRGQVLSLRF